MFGYKPCKRVKAMSAFRHEKKRKKKEHMKVFMISSDGKLIA